MKKRFRIRKAFAGFLAGLLILSGYGDVVSAAENDAVLPAEQSEETMPAEADETEGADMTAPMSDAATEEAAYSTDGGVNWQEASLIDAIWACYSAKDSEIKLLRDVVLTDDNWSAGVVLGANNCRLTLNGDGHTITRGDGVWVMFSVNAEGAAVTMKNITVDGGAIWNGDDPETRQNTGLYPSACAYMILVDNGASLTLESGTVLQNSDLGDNYYGAAVTVAGGTLTMKPGAVIRNNKARTGAGVYVEKDGVFVMDGGEISGNYTPRGGGGGVAVEGIFTMNDGQISGNVAGNNGGGVSILGNQVASVFTMTGGSILGNRAAVGGGGVSLLKNAVSFRMEGGSITENSLTSTSTLGGGILVNGGTLSMSGSVVVDGNTDVNGNNNNVYMRENAVAAVSAAMEAGARVGVTKVKDVDFTSGWTSQMGETSDPAEYFFSDAAAYDVIKDSVTGEAQLRSHDLTLTAAKEETCKEEGNRAYYTCKLCGKWYEDEAGSTEILDKTTVVIPVKAHTFGDWIVDKEATATEEGSRHRVCSVCQDTETEAIPALGTGGDAGNVEKDVEKGEGAPEVSLPMDTGALADAVLSEEDKEGIADGTDVKILLVVTDIDDTVSETDKETVEAALGSFTVGQYLDVELVKVINDSRTNILETKSPIRIVIAVPDSLKANGRTYAVIRVHDGVAAVLADQDSDPDTVTIDTDLFSTYTLVYTDAKAPEGQETGSGNGGNGNSGSGSSGTQDAGQAGDSAGASEAAAVGAAKDNEPQTGDNFRPEIYATIAMITGLTYLMLLFAGKSGMTKERKEELVSRLTRWAKQGGKPRRLAALAAITLLLVYYHSIGRQVPAELKTR